MKAITRCPSCNFGNQISTKTVQFVCRKCGIIVKWETDHWREVN